MPGACGIPATGYSTEVGELGTNSARLAARPIVDGGTPAAAWTGWQRTFPPLAVDECSALVLVAAHPDDETLGLGGTAALLGARGITVQVVSVTDGEAAYAGDDCRRAQLARLRREELLAATTRLGLPKPLFFRIPDGEVASHERRLTAKLAAVLAGFDGAIWCAATWRGDGHPDHEAVGRAAAAAAKDAGAVLLEYPIWMWHWAIPEDEAVPWHRARRVPLTATATTAKDDAIRCFTSQLRHGDQPPVLTPQVTERHLAVGEIVFV